MALNAVDEIARVFQGLAKEFCGLDPKLDISGADIYLSFGNVPQLPFPVRLTHEGAELTVYVGELFTGEWFPSTDQTELEAFAQNARDLLRGESRVREFVEGKELVRSQLESFVEGTWIALRTSEPFRLPWRRRRSREERILQRLPQGVPHAGISD